MVPEAYSGGGLWGLSPPGPIKSIDFKVFSGPNGCWAPPWKKKIKPPPWKSTWIRPWMVPRQTHIKSCIVSPFLTPQVFTSKIVSELFTDFHNILLNCFRVLNDSNDDFYTLFSLLSQLNSNPLIPSKMSSSPLINICTHQTTYSS